MILCLPDYYIVKFLSDEALCTISWKRIKYPLGILGIGDQVSDESRYTAI